MGFTFSGREAEGLFALAVLNLVMGETLTRAYR
jgi:hypothetical protein